MAECRLTDQQMAQLRELKATAQELHVQAEVAVAEAHIANKRTTAVFAAYLRQLGAPLEYSACLECGLVRRPKDAKGQPTSCPCGSGL